MRTDTATFRRNAFKTLRTQGLSSAKARLVLPILLQRLSRYSPEHPDGTEIRVSFDDAEVQTVAVVHEGIVRIHLDYHDLDDLQPLVNTVPTARQLELRDEMTDLTSAIYAAMSEGETAFAEEHGAPHLEGDYEAERLFVKSYQPYVDVLARYEAAKKESLAINPNVEAMVSDPERASFWYEWHREAYNYRPSGFRTLAMVEAEMATMPRHIETEFMAA